MCKTVFIAKCKLSCRHENVVVVVVGGGGGGGGGGDGGGGGGGGGVAVFVCGGVFIPETSLW